MLDFLAPQFVLGYLGQKFEEGQKFEVIGWKNPQI
jgi:hypothetical protein